MPPPAAAESLPTPNTPLPYSPRPPCGGARVKCTRVAAWPCPWTPISCSAALLTLLPVLALSNAEAVAEDAEVAGGTLSAEEAAEATEVRWLRIRQRQIAELEAAAADCGLTLGEGDMMPVVFQRVCVVCKVRWVGDGWSSSARSPPCSHRHTPRHNRRVGGGVVLVQAAMRLCGGSGSGASAQQPTFEPNALAQLPHTLSTVIRGFAESPAQRTAAELHTRPRHTDHGSYTALATAVLHVLSATTGSSDGPGG